MYPINNANVVVQLPPRINLIIVLVVINEFNGTSLHVLQYKEFVEFKHFQLII